MIVSEGTLRPQDLIPAFLSILKSLNEEEHYRFLRTYPEASDIQEELTPMQEELSEEMLQELFCFLDENAPKGMHFGAHEGDGALFGFWELPKEEEE